MTARGKLETRPTVEVKDHDDLSRVYTPGVGDDVQAIVQDPGRVDEVTGRRNRIFVVTDGSAILGLGDVGPQAGLPVMEGKSVLFKTLGGIDAWPLCLGTTDVEEIVRTVVTVSPGVGGINLEDISAPRCFEITSRLQEELDIPVFHDDQHGTAIVVLAALRNALRVAEKSLEEASIVVAGAGAAGSAVTRLLLHAGAGHVVVTDSHGVLEEGRDLDGEKRWLATHTNDRGMSGSLTDALRGADVFIGVSAPGLVGEEEIEAMAADPVLFGLANPDPEFDPEVARGRAAVIATGRSDLPNQINNVLVFPGVFRGLLDGGVSTVDEDVQVAAAEAIAGLVPREELGPERIIPDVFDERVVMAVADAVARQGA